MRVALRASTKTPLAARETNALAPCAHPIAGGDRQLDRTYGVESVKNCKLAPGTDRDTVRYNELVA
jgi:hypothetical protein